MDMLGTHISLKTLYYKYISDSHSTISNPRKGEMLHCVYIMFQSINMHIIKGHKLRWTGQVGSHYGA